MPPALMPCTVAPPHTQAEHLLRLAAVQRGSAARATPAGEAGCPAALEHGSTQLALALQAQSSQRAAPSLLALLPAQLHTLKSRYGVTRFASIEVKPWDLIVEALNAGLAGLAKVRQGCWLNQAPALNRKLCNAAANRCPSSRAVQQAGALRQLVLRQDAASLALLNSTLAPLASGLRRLHACMLAQAGLFMGSVDASVHLQAFTALEDLRLTAFGLQFGEAVRLPASLTSLALGTEVVAPLPADVPAVPLPQLVRRERAELCVCLAAWKQLPCRRPAFLTTLPCFYPPCSWRH